MGLKQVIYAAIGMFRILTKKVAPTVYIIWKRSRIISPSFSI